MSLISSYGLDGALSQIYYYHEFNDLDFYTVSKRKLDLAVETIKPKYIVGFKNVCYMDSDVIEPDNLHSSTYRFVEKTIKNTSNMKYAVLADKVKDPVNTEVIYQYYESVGHENFVNRFITTQDLTLTKNELTMAKLYIFQKQQLAESIVDNFCYYKEGFAICRSNFNMSKHLEDRIIEKYSDDGLKMILLYSPRLDNTVEVTLRSKGDIVTKIIELASSELNSDYEVNQEYDRSLIINGCTPSDSSETIYDVVKELFEKAEFNMKKEYYDKYDRMIQEGRMLDEII